MQNLLPVGDLLKVGGVGGQKGLHLLLYGVQPEHEVEGGAQQAEQQAGQQKQDDGVEGQGQQGYDEALQPAPAHGQAVRVLGGGRAGGGGRRGGAGLVEQGPAPVGHALHQERAPTVDFGFAREGKVGQLARKFMSCSQRQELSQLADLTSDWLFTLV